MAFGDAFKPKKASGVVREVERDTDGNIVRITEYDANAPAPGGFGSAFAPRKPVKVRRIERDEAGNIVRTVDE